MTPEEFQKIKEAEKEHLRALKKLKQAVRGIEQRNKVTKAVTDIASSTESLLSEHENLVERLAQETALQEARLELAMESAAERNQDSNSADVSPADLAQIDEDLAKKRASDLVRQMKSQMGGASTEHQGDPVAAIAPTVEKTIGRRQKQSESDTPDGEAKANKPQTAANKSNAPEKGEPAESDVPEKTIGRMRPKK